MGGSIFEEGDGVQVFGPAPPLKSIFFDVSDDFEEKKNFWYKKFFLDLENFFVFLFFSFFVVFAPSGQNLKKEEEKTYYFFCMWII